MMKSFNVVQDEVPTSGSYVLEVLAVHGQSLLIPDWLRRRMGLFPSLSI